MALEHAILVSLTEKSASGYDLARRFDASISHFWPATHQQIYKVLGRMESDKWVTSNLVAQDGKPDKKVYEITDEGRDVLDQWLAEPTAREPFRSEFAVKLRAATPAHVDTLIADTRRRRENHELTLAKYRENEAQFFPDPSAIPGELIGAWLTLRGGIRIEENGVAWCDEILTTLEKS